MLSRCCSTEVSGRSKGMGFLFPWNMFRDIIEEFAGEIKDAISHLQK
jgi:hypothetical protein